MTPKSVKRFSDKVMRKGRMTPKSVKRFSDKVMREGREHELIMLSGQLSGTVLPWE